MTTWAVQSFWNELDVLEVKLATLDGYVDVFVIAETTTTYSGDRKPLVFPENRDRFAPWLDKIVYVADTTPLAGREIRQQPNSITTACDSDRWARERAQRDLLSIPLRAVEPDDLIFLSDCDEIPDPERCWTTGEAFAREGQIARPTLAMHVGRMTWRWNGALPVIARFFTARTLAAFGGSVEAVRQSEGRSFGPCDALGLGWHLSYLGGVDAVRHKLSSAAHHELDTPPYNDPEHIQRCLDTGRDLFDRPNRQCHRCPIDELPSYVQKHQERFEALL